MSLCHRLTLVLSILTATLVFIGRHSKVKFWKLNFSTPCIHIPTVALKYVELLYKIKKLPGLPPGTPKTSNRFEYRMESQAFTRPHVTYIEVCPKVRCHMTSLLCSVCIVQGEFCRRLLVLTFPAPASAIHDDRGVFFTTPASCSDGLGLNLGPEAGNYYRVFRGFTHILQDVLLP
jgi:hypothetical protein